MYTIGSLADLISGADTPNKRAVKLKEVQYKKPTPADNTIGKKPSKPKNGKQSKSIVENKKLNKPNPTSTPVGIGVKLPKNGKHTKSNVENKKLNNKKPKPAGEILPENEKEIEPTELTRKSILENNKLSNAEKRAMLKRKSSESGTPKQPKKSKMEHRIDRMHHFTTNTVFVGNVPLDTEESDLKNLFSKYGDIQAIRFRGIPKADKKMSKKLAFIKKKFHPKATSMLAYVVFKSEQAAIDAEKANGTNLKNHSLRVENLTNGQDKHNKNKSIFIGNLPFAAADDELRKLFENCGTINSVRLVRDTATNMGKGFGFVNFESPDSVELALQMENVVLRKKKLRIQRCSQPEEKNKKKTADGKKIRQRYGVRIENLPKHTTESDLRYLFKDCGKILSIRIFTANKNGFGFVNFENSEAVAKAVNKKNPTLYKASLKITECKPNPNENKPKETKSKKAIFIQNLPRTTTYPELHKLFEDCGNISFCKIYNKPKRGVENAYAIVNFKTEEAVEKALERNFKIGTLELEISRKSTRPEPTTEEEINEPEGDEDADESEEEQSDADEELIKDINGTKNWEDDSDSNEDEEDDDDDDANEENDDNEEEDNDDEEDSDQGEKVEDDSDEERYPDDEQDDDDDEEHDPGENDSDDNEDVDSDENDEAND